MSCSEHRYFPGSAPFHPSCSFRESSATSAFAVLRTVSLCRSIYEGMWGSHCRLLVALVSELLKGIARRVADKIVFVV